MKRINSRKFRLNYQVWLYVDGKLTKRIGKRMKTQLLIALQGTPFTKGLLKVEYKKGVDNQAEFTTYDEFKGLLNYFTDKETLDYAEHFVPADY